MAKKTRSYGRYQLIDRIAVGGMGEIWKAKLTGLEGFEKIVAIKKILPHLSDDPQFVERLVVEAKISVALTHTHIVGINELGRVEGEYYIAMDYIDGPDLATLLQRVDRLDKVIPTNIALHIIGCTCKALDYAHAKTNEKGQPMNIVHRDVSPQNILLSRDGAVKLSDFGIARAAGVARLYKTQMGAVLGKRRYMPPEQRKGEPVDQKADVFSVGAVLYEVLTGTAPSIENPPPPSEINPSSPNALDPIVMSAIDPCVETRLSSARALFTALDQIRGEMLIEEPSMIRDPGDMLGSLVTELFPPNERSESRRSLTSFFQAAMGNRVALPTETEPLTGRPLQENTDVKRETLETIAPNSREEHLTEPTVNPDFASDSKSASEEMTPVQKKMDQRDTAPTVPVVPTKDKKTTILQNDSSPQAIPINEKPSPTPPRSSETVIFVTRVRRLEEEDRDDTSTPIPRVRPSERATGPTRNKEPQRAATFPVHPSPDSKTRASRPEAIWHQRETVSMPKKVAPPQQSPSSDANDTATKLQKHLASLIRNISRRNLYGPKTTKQKALLLAAVAFFAIFLGLQIAKLFKGNPEPKDPASPSPELLRELKK